MKNNNEYIAISIESRKGGVGKTTVAMNLARLFLVHEKYEVIFLDLDMSGTEASKFVPSLQKQKIWTDRIHIIKKPNMEDNHPELNIVELFESYMMGEEIPNIVWESNQDRNGTHEFVLSSGKINLFSSFIKRKNQYSNESGHIYGPAVLFDEIHSFWFIAMIKDLVNKCSQTLSPEKKLVVIIDNAPGYSGLEPVIEDWLTDLGPLRSKFLFICSVDTQDILACFKSLSEIEHIYNTKWDASRKFLSMAIDKQIDSIEDIHKIFFNRLAETYSNCNGIPANSPQCIDCGLCFYRSRITEAGELFKNTPPLSLAIIVNKVPESIYQEHYKLKIGDLLNGLGIPVNDSLTLDNLESFHLQKEGVKLPEIIQVLSFLKSNQIPFKSELSLQFCIDRLSQDGEFLSEFSIDMRDKIKTIIKRLHKKTLPQLSLFGDPLSSCIESRINLIDSFDYSFFKVIKEFQKISEFPIQDFWTDTFFLRDQYNLLFQNLPNFQSYLSMGSVFPRRDINYDSVQKNVAFLFHETNLSKQVIQRFINLTDNNWDIILKVPNSLIETILTDILIDIAISWEITGYNRDFYREIEKEKFIDEYSIILTTILLDLFSDKKIIANPRILNQKKFWLDRYKTTSSNLRKIISLIKENYLVSKNTNYDSDIIQINNRLCKIKIRLLDANEDFIFISECFGSIVKIHPTTSFYLTTLKELTQKVILDKTLTHADGRDYLMELERSSKEQDDIEILKNATELAEFNEVLNSILGKSQWDLM